MKHIVSPCTISNFPYTISNFPYTIPNFPYTILSSQYHMHYYTIYALLQYILYMQTVHIIPIIYHSNAIIM